MRRDWAWIAAILVIANVATALLLWHGPDAASGFPLDDGWIHQVYARNLATSGLFAYNPGVSESGMTSPLWVVVCAAAWWPGRILGLEPSLLPRLLSLVFGIVAALGVVGLLRRRGASALLAGAMGLLLSLDPSWCFSRCGGMEVTLFAALLVGAVLALERDALAVCGILAGLAVVTRPEGLLPVAGLAVLGVASSPGRRIRALSWLLLPALVGFGAWTLYNLHVTGYPLPNTFYAKAQTDALVRWDNVQAIAALLARSVAFHRTWVGMVLGGIGLVCALRDGWRGAAWGVVPGLFLAGLAVTHTFVQPWPYYWLRYLHPVWPFLVLWIGRGLLPLETWVQARVARLGLAGGALLVLGFVGLGALAPAATLYDANCRNVRQGDVDPALWIRDHTDPDDVVAGQDAGALRFFGERTTLDLMGLNDANLVHHRDRWLEIVRDANADWFVVFPDQIGPVLEDLDLEAVATFENRPFTICACPTQERVVIYRRR